MGNTARDHMRVDIYGAGIAGLVASIHLARDGHEVHLYDRESVIGGNPQWHPSVQTTVLDLEETSRYIGIDLSECFRPVNSITFYRYGRKKTFALKNMYVCERGPRKGSLESRLFELAAELEVRHHPSVPFSALTGETDQPVILATGLDPDVFRKLGMPHVPIHGYRGIIRTDRQAALIAYMDECTSYDFAYLAADKGLLFALLFSRGHLPEESLGAFQRLLKETEGVQIDAWTYSIGAMPIRPRLFRNGYVLAGTLGGMIDPFVLHGISGALISGRIAARAITDRTEAEREFRRMTRSFAAKNWLKAVSARLPGKSVTLPVMMWVDSLLPGVGFVG